MQWIFLYPSTYFDPKQVDPDFEDEYETMHQLSKFQTCLFDYDAFISAGILKFYPSLYEKSTCIYRGWMMKPEQYRILYQTLEKRSIQLINSPAEYDACHLFPKVYALVEKFTPKAIWFPDRDDINWKMVNNNFKRFMIKDYVKSVKGSNFPTSFSTPVDEMQMRPVLDQFLELRGDLFTGGFLFKEFVELKCYTDVTNEYRAFFLDGNLLTLSKNSNQADTCPYPPDNFVTQFRNLPSRFYTVDFAECADGNWIVLETGDGQVSGLASGQDTFIFYDKIRRFLLTE